MFILSPLWLGIGLVVVGGALFLLTLLLLHLLPRLQPRLQPGKRTDSLPPVESDLEQHGDAVLVVQPGGRIVYSNPKARQLLQDGEEELSLERLSNRLRPTDTFLSLCAAEGQTKLTLDGQLLEATSYYAPGDGTSNLVVCLRQPQIYVSVTNIEAQSTQPGQPSRSVATLAELTQAMNASLELEVALKAILESVERLIPTDYMEISLWEAGKARLLPYRFLGRPGEERRLEKAPYAYAEKDGFPGALISTLQPVYYSDIQADPVAAGLVRGTRTTFRSYIGLPLLHGEELIGALELYSLTPNRYVRKEFELARILAGSAEIAVYNASRYEADRRRAKVLAGLAQLSQSLQTFGKEEDLFTEINESISALIDVRVLGFLVYDENRQLLAARHPFRGLPTNVVDLYQISVEPGSAVEAQFQSGEMIVASEGPQDPQLEALGAHAIALAAGIRSTILAPLTSAGSTIGYLQVGDKRDGSPFEEEDVQLLAMIAAHAAPIIHNASLLQRSQRRAQRAEMLRRIASLTGSAATLDEILKYSLVDLVRLLDVEVAALYLFDEDRAELRLHKASMIGIDAENAARLSRFSHDHPLISQSLEASSFPLIYADLIEQEFLPAYRPVVDQLAIRSLMVLPMVFRDVKIGEMIVAGKRPEAFSPGDIQTAQTAAAQLAAAVRQAALYQQTDKNLQQRLDQLTAIIRISRELNTHLQLEYLLQKVYDELLQTTGADCGTIVLFDVSEDASPPVRNVLLALGDAPSERLGWLEEQVLAEGEPLVIDDFEIPLEELSITPPGDTVNVEPPHAEIRSGLLVPIAYQEQVAGLIYLHAKEPHAFNPAARQIAEALSIHAAIALGNAYRYQEQIQRNEQLNRRIEILTRLIDTSKELRMGKSLEEVLESIAYAIQDATPFDMVLISVYDRPSARFKRVSGAGIPLGVMAELRAHGQPYSGLQELIKPEFKMGAAYFIPSEKAPVVPVEVHSVSLVPPEQTSEEAGSWHAEDALLVPLYSAQDERPLGMISVDGPRDQRRPDRVAIEALEVFASQAALAIESYQRVQKLEYQLETLQTELMDAKFTAKNLPDLMQKDLEQTMALQAMGQRAERIQAGLAITQVVNRSLNRQQLLEGFAQEMLGRMDSTAVLVAENRPDGPRLLHALGDLPAGLKPETLLGQKNPLWYCLQTGEMILVSYLAEVEWKNSPLLERLGANGFVCLPIVVDGAVDAAILAAGQSPLAPFDEEDRLLFSLISQQLSIALQNQKRLEEAGQRLKEYNMLMAFSQQLSGLDVASILQTLVQSALVVVPHAQAAMVAVWDEAKELLEVRAAAGYPKVESMLGVRFRKEEALPGTVFATGQPVILGEVDFAQQYKLSAENLLHYRDATAGKPPLSCMAVPMLSTPQAQPLGVLVLDHFEFTQMYTSDDQTLLSTLAQQAALTLENARLYHASRQRAQEMQALSGVAATLTSTLRSESLVATVLDHLQSVVPFDTGTLWLKEKQQLVVNAARGFADGESPVGLSVAIEDSLLFPEMVETRLPILVGNQSLDPRFPSLMPPERLSWLGLPLIVSDQVIGVIALEKTEAYFYTPEHVQTALTIASQAAVGLENASLYEESLQRAFDLDKQSQRLTTLYRLSTVLSGSLDVNRILDEVIQELARAVHCTSVSAVIYGADAQAWLQAEAPHSGLSIPALLPQTPLYDRLRESLGVFSTAEIASETDLEPLADFLAVKNTRSLLALPLVSGVDTLGLLFAHVDRTYNFSPEEVELARTIVNQGAIALQNARLFAETRSLTEDLENRVVLRTSELAEEHQRTETLLRIITELSASLDLDQVLNRTLHVLNEFVEAERVMILISREGQRDLQTLAYLGSQNEPALDMQSSAEQVLAWWVMRNRKAALISDLHDDARWVQPAEGSSAIRSALAAPLMIGAEALGALLMFAKEPAHFSNDHLDLVQAAANQVAVAVNNSELYRLIRDQAEGLGSMLRNQQIETSRSRAILEAVADGVVVTDANMKITLFNASAEKILGMERGQVVGKSLEHFTGLFGKAAHSWMETIKYWSQDGSTYQLGDTHTEQITLEDGKVVSVRLAPVSLRSDFLGTVSIFQDITHQVEVDRLKSEFVATVSHELRTPMTSIKGYVEILLMGAAGELNEQQSRFLEVVRENNDRLAVLVNDLLDISKIESGRISLVRTPLDLEGLVDNELDVLRRKISEDHKEIQLEKFVEPDLPRVYADMERVRQILTNLLDNAYQYNMNGGRVTVRLKRAGEAVQIDVQDAGVGIPQDEQQQVFERFFRGESPLMLGVAGTGLGLSIVQSLVHMHGGEIWLESSGVYGEGTTFSFTLPIYTVDENILEEGKPVWQEY